MCGSLMNGSDHEWMQRRSGLFFITKKADEPLLVPFIHNKNNTHVKNM